jgi:hypothetical protein
MLVWWLVDWLVGRVDLRSSSLYRSWLVNLLISHFLLVSPFCYVSFFHSSSGTKDANGITDMFGVQDDVRRFTARRLTYTVVAGDSMHIDAIDIAFNAISVVGSLVEIRGRANMIEDVGSAVDMFCAEDGEEDCDFADIFGEGDAGTAEAEKELPGEGTPLASSVLAGAGVRGTGRMNVGEVGECLVEVVFRTCVSCPKCGGGQSGPWAGGRSQGHCDAVPNRRFWKRWAGGREFDAGDRGKGAVCV